MNILEATIERVDWDYDTSIATISAKVESDYAPIEMTLKMDVCVLGDWVEKNKKMWSDHALNYVENMTEDELIHALTDAFNATRAAKQLLNV